MHCGRIQQFHPVDGMHLNGKLTLSENAADNGGIHLAYMALMRKLANKTIPDAKVDGLTPQQQFFVGFAQVWCENATDASAKVEPLPILIRRVSSGQTERAEKSAGVSGGFLVQGRRPHGSAESCRVW